MSLRSLLGRPARLRFRGSARQAAAVTALVIATSPLVTPAYANGLPTIERSGEYVSFVSDRTGNDELYLSRPDGTEVEQLTDNAGFDRAPSWGSSGRTLVFNSRREPHTDRPQIYSLNITTGATTRLTDSEVEEHRASIDERAGTVYFHRGRMFQTAFELWAKDLGTGQERQLTHSVSTAIWNAAPAISPDGTEVLFQSNLGEANPVGPFPQKLYLLDLVTNAIISLPAPEGLATDVSYDGGRWNSDGTAIAFSASTDEGSIVYIAERDPSGGWQSQVLTDVSLDASAPAWSPDDTRIVFQSTDPLNEDRTEIRVISLADGQVTTIGEGRTPVWTRIAPAPAPVAEPEEQGVAGTTSAVPELARTGETAVSPLAWAIPAALLACGAALLMAARRRASDREMRH